MLNKLLQAIEDGKLADVERLLADLEAKTKTLLAPLPDQIGEARKALDAAKLGQGPKYLVPPAPAK